MKAIMLVIMILLNCGILNKPPKKDPREIDFLTSAALLNRDSGEKAEVIDNKDGTLNYTYIKWSSTAGIYTETRGKTILVRRCLIGQVYRPEQNDCRGTGTESNVWGRLKFQWCPTNDTSCEVNGIADPTKSPAAKACAEDTFLGKKWRLPSLEDRFSAVQGYPKELVQELAGTQGEPTWSDWMLLLSWTNVSHSDTESYNTQYFNPLGTYPRVRQKTEFLNSICVGDMQ
jgi:hypothetical protein